MIEIGDSFFMKRQLPHGGWVPFRPVDREQMLQLYTRCRDGELQIIVPYLTQRVVPDPR